MTEHALLVANDGDSPWVFAVAEGIKIQGIEHPDEVVLWYKKALDEPEEEIARFGRDGLFDLSHTSGFYRVTRNHEPQPITVSLVR